ncbi:disease resistance protein (CC-NBS-LRR class) family protein, partial [Trifolium medium]|nr:disease resistance protein (CC-NBS-LRR class) family protein [Trifolium medium]
TVSKTPNLKNIVQKLFRHYGLDEPPLADNEDAGKQFRSLLNRIRESGPVMLVLDNVFPGLESFVETLRAQVPDCEIQARVPDCKILITSRVVFPRFETSSLKPLNNDDAVTLFRHVALPKDGKKRTYDPDEQYVQQVCYIHPITLNIV